MGSGRAPKAVDPGAGRLKTEVSNSGRQVPRAGPAMMGCTG